MRLALKSICSTILIGHLVGCGPPSYLARAQELANSGRCNEADAQIRNNESDPGRKAGILGAIAHDCHKDQELANRYLTLSARYGNPVAQDQLMRARQPVPPADLKGRDTDCVVIGRVISCSSD